MKIIETSSWASSCSSQLVFRDERGFFIETYRLARYAHAGIGGAFAQDNVSRSVRGTLRGLHFQEPHAQGKLVHVIRGSVFDVANDIRSRIPDLRALVRLRSRTTTIFRCGFRRLCPRVLRDLDVADFMRWRMEPYVPAANRGILWNDPDPSIAWPGEALLFPPPDRVAPRLKDATILPNWAPG